MTMPTAEEILDMLIRRSEKDARRVEDEEECAHSPLIDCPRCPQDNDLGPDDWQGSFEGQMRVKYPANPGGGSR